MFVFEREQQIFDIGGVTVGGTPGENPTVLAGTIFYSGDKTVRDARTGEFDAAEAERLVTTQDELSDMTGNPALVQVFAQSPRAVERYIDFVSEVTDAPFLIDSTDPETRVAGLRHAEEVGLLDRAVYNSVNISMTEDERMALSEMGQLCAIVLAFNPHDATIAGRRAVLESGTPEMGEGLLETCEKVGINRPLIDTAMTSLGAGAGPAVAFTLVAKSLYGYPTGCGIHNAVSSWPWLLGLKRHDKEAYRTCDVASNVIVQLMGGDFVLYGPIKNARLVFPVAAMADALAAECVSMELGVSPADGHPFRRLV